VLKHQRGFRPLLLASGEADEECRGQRK
jgi:hypothetical protein